MDHDHRTKNYWLVAVPHSKTDPTSDIFTDLRRDVSSLLEESHQFLIPGAKSRVDDTPGLIVGNIDSLFALSDDLRKLDTHVESTLRKIATEYRDLTVEGEQFKELDVKGSTAQTFLTRFRWDNARFSIRKTLPQLTRIIESGIAKMDAELRSKSGEYAIVEQKLNQIKQSTTGSLVSRDITKDIESAKIVNSKYLTTLFVVVPNSEIKEWHKSYERICAPEKDIFVVPGSSEELKKEPDYSLFKVIVFQKDAEDFKAAARQKRFTVRKYDPSASLSAEELAKLKAKHDKLRRQLQRWAMTNFGEAFFLWVHLKCIQCYVEAILRFGLPVNFEAMLLLPKREQDKRLEKVLCDKYAYLSRDFGGDDEHEDETKQANEKYYPFVFLEIPVKF